MLGGKDMGSDAGGVREASEEMGAAAAAELARAAKAVSTDMRALGSESRTGWGELEKKPACRSPCAAIHWVA